MDSSSVINSPRMGASRSMPLRWLLVLGVFAGVGSMVWLALPDAPVSVNQGDQITDFSLPDIHGAMHSVPKGDVMLLNFWATWCPPCRREIPSMASLYDKYASRGLKVIAVSVDQRRDDLTSFMKEYSMAFQVLHDADGVVSRSYGVFRYPESFLVDRDGKVLLHVIGAKNWMSEPLTRTIEQMLGKPASDVNGLSAGDKKPEQG